MKGLSILVVIALAALLCGCISPEELPSGKINVVTTIAPQRELIKSVGKDFVNITVLVPPGAEPHTFEPTPSQMRAVADADLYIMNGAGLEFWMDRLLQVNKKMVVVDTSKGIDLVWESGGEADPHIWLSLRNAVVQLDNIYQGLVQVDPDNKDFYLKNKEEYVQKLQSLDAELNQSFSTAHRKIFVVHHPAWTYFARDYNLEQVPLMENEKEPGPKYLGEVIDLARKNNITAIFVEPEFNPKAAEVIAKEMNARIIDLDPLAENYLENMRHAGKMIAESLVS
ncbi:MAG: zinc ABC transporter solute-binding protein [Veillonellaceae bacterium]|nr:zinc ABC transporter solute-binding protein [Veillonellaceae bacterium]